MSRRVRGTAPAVFVALLALLAAGPVPGAARGVLLRAGDVVTAGIAADGDTDAFTVEIAGGTTLDAAVSAVAPLLPTLRLYRPDLTEAPPGAFLTGAGTGKLALKKFPVPAGQTGLWTLVVGSTGATTGTYTIAARYKMPKAPAMKALPVPAGGVATVEFTGADDALVTVKAKVAGGPLASARLLDPDGAPVAGSGMPGGAAFALAAFRLTKGFGTYTLEMTGGAADALVSGSIKVAYPKPLKRKVTLAPEATLTAQSFVVRQDDTARPLALAGTNFRAGSTVVVSGEGVSVVSVGSTTATSLEFGVAVEAHAAYGARDLTLVPPVLEGEPVALSGAVTVKAPLPTISGSTGGPVVQGQAREITVTGTGFRSGGSIGLSPSTGLSVSNAYLDSSTQFRFTLTPSNAWSTVLGPVDVTFTQSTAGGGDPVTGAGIVQVHAPSPTVASFTPSALKQGESARRVTLSGTNFRPGGTISIASTSGLSLGATTVSSATSAYADVTVSSAAGVGDRTVTFTQATGLGGAAASAATALPVRYPDPTVVNVSPNAVLRGASGTLTLTGTGFRTGGAVSTTADVDLANPRRSSDTVFLVDYSVDAGATLGTGNVTYTQPADGGAAAATLVGGLSVSLPFPTLTNVSGGDVTCGGASVEITLTGTNFDAGGTISVPGSSGLTLSSQAFDSSTRMRVTVGAADGATAGSFPVRYTHPAAGGGTSATLSDALLVRAATPTVSAVSPTTVEQGASGVLVTVTGTKFQTGGAISFSGTGLTLGSTTVASSTSASVSVTVASGATLGKRDVTFTQPAGAGGASGTLAQGLEVTAPQLQLTSVSPAGLSPGQSRVAVTLTGSGFDSGTSVSVSGSNVTVHSTTYVSATTLALDVSAASAATVGARDLTITPSVLSPKTFTGALRVLPADPVVTGFSHPALGKGAASVSVTVVGHNFRSGAALSASGSGVTFSSVTVVNSARITASASVATDAATGLRDLTVSHSTADGGRAGTLEDALRVVGATPTVSAVSPGAAGRTGSGGATRTVPVTITGTDFMTGATVSLSRSGGSGVSAGTATVVSGTTIAVDLSVTGSATTGTWDVVVTNPGGLGNSGTSGNGLFDVRSESTRCVNRVLPASGETLGGERVTIHGSGFAAGDVVDFGTQRAYRTQVIDQNTIVTTVPQPAATSTSGPTAVDVKVTASGGGSATLTGGYSYAVDELDFYALVKTVPASGATGVPINLVSACVLLPAPLKTSTVTYGTSDSSAYVVWFESGGFVTANGARAFGPGNRWLVFTRTGGGNLAINNQGKYVLSMPAAMQSIGGVNFVPDGIRSLTVDQESFTLDKTGGTTDTTAPTLSSITPAASSSGRDTTTAVTLLFSEEIDPQTVTASNITFKQGSTTVGAHIAISDDLKTVTLSPETELSASTTYTTTVGAGVKDLFGNAFSSTAYAFTTGSGTDATVPVVTAVTVEDLPSSVDGSGTHTTDHGSTWSAFDVYLDQSGFLLRVDFTDDGGAGIDPSTFSAKCSAAVGSSSAGTELASNFTVTHTHAEWRVPSSSLVASGDDVVFTFGVQDYAANSATAATVTVDVAAKTSSSTNGGDLDPLGTRDTWVLRADLDAYTTTLSTQASPALQGATTTVSGNGKTDFDETLRLVGLSTASMTSAAAAAVNGPDTGTNAIMRRLVLERTRELLRERYEIDADGTADAGAVDIEFLLPGEQGSLSALPLYSTAKGSATGYAYSELSLGATEGADSNTFVGATTLGKAYYDTRNRYSQADINDDGTVGIFLLGMLKGDVNVRNDDGGGNPTEPFFRAVSAKFVAIHGGTPVGEHASDDDVLADTFDRATSGSSTHNARYDDIMDAVEVVALQASSVAAHEIGHSLGLVPDGAPKKGLFGGAHEENPFTRATSLSPNTSHHLAFAGMNNLMAAASSTDERMRTGTGFQRFCPPAIAWLRRILIHDEAK